MSIKLPIFIRKLLKATQFWQENRLILREFRYFRGLAILALGFTFLAAIFEGFGVGFLMTFLQNLTEPDAAPMQTGLEWFDIWILGVNMTATTRLYRISTLILITTLLRTGFTYLGKVYTEITRSHLLYRLRVRLFDQFQSLSFSYFTQTRSGELINSITTEVANLREAFGIFANLVIRGSTLLVYVISMLLLSWQLTIISLMLFILLSVCISNLVRRVREISFTITKANSQYTSVALEFIQGVRTIQASAAQNFERQRFEAASSQLLERERKFAFYRSSAEPISEAAATAILIAMLMFAFATLTPTGQLPIASLLTFLFILFRLMPIVRQINGARSRLGGFQGSLHSIRELLRTDNKTYLKNGEIQFSGFKRAIEFRSVDFGYDRHNLVLQNITLTIECGKTTALVGASGAGKTTLADLIPRFYDPTQGQIFIDGVPLQELDINSLRRKLAVVSQDTFIFHTSVRNNIAYAMEEMDDSAILEAAKLANALEFIQDLPEGLDTQLGDRGVRLSGGQRQRIAIARALLRNPEILILDEATSALDSVSERLIQESLEKLSVGRTVIAIAHRLSTIARADKVVVLEQGKIVEQGSYHELLEQRGKLWKYHEIQHEKSSA
ncbi:ABC transporter ATP-binding protein [Oscillatoriales cyanobacterium LEGE 11467]|uniref:ABC transporter ATP-binding protein n=1 Tax=Zarconia navalis LEGE 11467 TaxID=1828826 RepID=A0A928VSZ7_9CYAN|nr:heterocyst formation ABC transporter subunit HepA [Zarconia navalis]MBE9039591.1 ABC transporter ATP-binding protein [Zarconia navalis LEGE 11467]